MRRLTLWLLVAGLALAAMVALYPRFDGPEAMEEAPRLRRRDAPVRPREPALEAPVEAELVERHEVTVLADGDEPEAVGSMPWERVVVVPGLVRGRIDGAALLEVLRSVGPVRFRRSEDLEALREATLMVEAQEGRQIQLHALVNLCREAGLVLDDAGRAWWVHDFDSAVHR